MSYQVGLSVSCQFKLDTSAWSEGTQQKSQSTPRPAATFLRPKTFAVWQALGSWQRGASASPQADAVGSWRPDKHRTVAPSCVGEESDPHTKATQLSLSLSASGTP